MRLERWSSPEFISIPATYDRDQEGDDPLEQLMWDRQKMHEDETESWRSNTGMMRAARELIYAHKEGKPVFHYIGYSFNVQRGLVQLSHILDILPTGDSAEAISEDIRNTLAVAQIYEVPVLPNSDELASELATHYRDLALVGFTAPDGEGGRMRLRLVDSPGEKVGSVEHFLEMRLSRPQNPAEIAAVREAVETELARLSEAHAILSALDLAIVALEGSLESTDRNEHDLQTCLTTHPVLFGPEYRAVIPKHRLGSDFEMDYALRRASGLYDLLEIESGNLMLFTKSGNPTKHLVHAEQQVLDWLRWIERHYHYAESKLPELTSPLAYVVIGRSATLSPKDRDRLLQRNAIFRDRLRIMTYDDLLERAKHLRRYLTAATPQK